MSDTESLSETELVDLNDNAKRLFGTPEEGLNR